MIKFDETIRAMVYCQFANDTDWLVGVNETEDGKFTSRGRVRVYREDTGDPFKDRDKKFWFTSKEAKDLDACLNDVKSTLQKLMWGANELFAKPSKDPTVHIAVRGARSLEDFLQEWSKLPFVHSKVVKDDASSG